MEYRIHVAGGQALNCWPLADNHNPVSRRRRPYTQNGLAQQRVYNARFARIERTDQHDQKWVIGMEQRIARLIQLFGGQTAHLAERLDQRRQRLELFPAQGFVARQQARLAENRVVLRVRRYTSITSSASPKRL